MYKKPMPYIYKSMRTHIFPAGVEDGEVALDVVCVCVFVCVCVREREIDR